MCRYFCSLLCVKVRMFPKEIHYLLADRYKIFGENYFTEIPVCALVCSWPIVVGLVLGRCLRSRFRNSPFLQEKTKVGGTSNHNNHNSTANATATTKASNKQATKQERQPCSLATHNARYLQRFCQPSVQLVLQKLVFFSFDGNFYISSVCVWNNIGTSCVCF
mgnify:CR=1 FL=1